MHKLLRPLVHRLPLDFRVLYSQFLLRIVDLEALSIEADIPRFLGQFAGVLMMFSMIQTIGLGFALLGQPDRNQAAFISLMWVLEQRMVFTTMLVAGLIAVLGWDSIFPDRRDILILSPLPVHPRTILFAKMAAAAAVLGLAVLALNFAIGFALSLVLGGIPRLVPALSIYFFTVGAAGIFLLGSVLTVQGCMALLLPRRLFMRLSALVQIASLALFLCVYLLEETIAEPRAFSSPANHLLLAWSPPYWFFALFNQLNGTLPLPLAWLAHRAWAGLAIAVIGATGSLLLCYLRTIRKTVEEPDLLPSTRRFFWALPCGSQLHTAILAFSFRSLTRSRQHRVLLAFYLGIGFAIALLDIKADSLWTRAPHPLSLGLLIATFAILGFALIGLRNVYALPISLTANWVLRTTQLSPSAKYIAAARNSLLLFAVLPAWLASALFVLSSRPLTHVAQHLLVLALLGFLLAEVSLIGFYKVPFTCSYLPGKSNFQFSFWTFLVAFAPLAFIAAEYELKALCHPSQYVSMVLVLAAAAIGIGIYNRHRSRSAVLYFEELPEEVLTALHLTSNPVSQPNP